MEVYQAASFSPSFNPHYSTVKSESFDKLAEDFEKKLDVSEAEPDGSHIQTESAEQKPRLEEEDGDLDFQFACLNPSGSPVDVSEAEPDGSDTHTESSEQKPQLEKEEEEDGEDGDSDFEFACLNPVGSPVSADDIFDNGKIRPYFPLFNRDLLFADSELNPSLPPPMKKVFAEAGVGGGADEPGGTYCEWTARIVEETPPSPGSCRKSNSTGSSKLWRLRDLLPRSNSDGKDALVMLSPPANVKPSDGGVEKAKKSTEKAVERKEAKVEQAKKGKGKGKGKTTAPSAHEKHYVKSRAVKESDKRKSYLPYRRDLLGLGFFTSVNGLSKNVHPF